MCFCSSYAFLNHIWLKTVWIASTFLMRKLAMKWYLMHMCTSWLCLFNKVAEKQSSTVPPLSFFSLGFEYSRTSMKQLPMKWQPPFKKLIIKGPQIILQSIKGQSLYEPNLQ